MTIEQNKALVRRFYAAFEASDYAALNELLAADLTAYSHGSPDPQNREAHIQGIRVWNSAFSATRFTVEEQIAEGDSIATRVTMYATHSAGDFQGLPPTGKQVAVPAVSIERIRQDRIVERRVHSDWLGMLRQLGLVPPA